VGQTKQQIVDRLKDHSKPHKFLFDFTAGGEVPTFLVVHSKHELSAGEAVYSEHKLIALAGESTGTPFQLQSSKQGKARPPL
jgi:hypothetical protein